ncbi:MAG: hypothetical protein K5681_08580 [Treponema sp.]|nr:hypothetical protein [Treponema sp.]
MFELIIFVTFLLWLIFGALYIKYREAAKKRTILKIYLIKVIHLKAPATKYVV